MTKDEKCGIIRTLTPAEEESYCCEITLSDRYSYISVTYYDKAEYTSFLSSKCRIGSDCATWAADTAATARALAAKGTAAQQA